MRFTKTLTLLLLATGLVFALSAWAQQSLVAPTFRSARADLKVSATTAISGAQRKPFTLDQVQGLVRDGFGDESGAKLVEQFGIDFVPAEDFMQSLKAAGASEAFLQALHAAKPPEPASAKKPLNQVQVFALLARHWVPPALSLAGLLLGMSGVMLLGFHGYLDAKANCIRLCFRLLFSSNPMRGQPPLDREPPVWPTLWEHEVKGWRLLAWGFTLQAISVILSTLIATFL